MKILPILVYLVLLMSPITKASNEDIEVTKLENFLLQFRLGNSRIMYSKHTFLHYLNLVTVIKQVNSLVISFKKISHKISQSNDTHPVSYHSLIQNMLTRTAYLISLAQRKFGNIYPHTRSKRGLINGIGKINKWLFGNHDSNDETRYNPAISVLQENQKNILQETYLQISLYQKLIEHYNTSIVTSGKKSGKNQK